MGFLDILKRGKTEPAPAPTDNSSSSLPPLPQGIPEIPPPPSNMQDNIPKYNIPPMDSPMLGDAQMETTSLPQMPYEQEPQMPEIPEAPDMSVSTSLELPKMPEPKEVEIPEIPKDFPAPSAGGYVPDKVPPLEGLGKIPKFKEEPELALPVKTELPKTKVRRPNKGPMFVKVTAFKDLIDTMDSVLIRFKDEDDIFFRVTDIKNTQDKKFENYRQTLEDIQRKILFVDKTLFDR